MGLAGRKRAGSPRTTLTVLVYVAVLGLGVHLYAVSLESTARDVTLPIARRIAAAERALAIEPFNPSFEVTSVIVQAQSLLSSGRVDDAYFLLLPHSTTVSDDALFRSVYQGALAAKTPLDARKAHQQHAREREDGALSPDDVMR